MYSAGCRWKEQQAIERTKDHWSDAPRRAAFGHLPARSAVLLAGTGAALDEARRFAMYGDDKIAAQYVVASLLGNAVRCGPADKGPGVPAKTSR